MTALVPRPVHESLQAHSPLETLVRRTSSRRKPSRPAEPLSIPVPRDTEEEDAHSFSRRNIGRPPSSPLLHTRFRTSTGTHSSFNTSIDLLNRSHDRGVSQAISFDDDASMYSTEPASPHRSNNMLSTAALGTYAAPPAVDYAYDDLGAYPSGPRPRRSSEIDPFMFRDARTSEAPPLPQVVVSAAPDPVDYYDRWPAKPSSVPLEMAPGRARTVSNSSAVNYSRPNRPSLVRSEDSEEAKRRVLERNKPSSMRSPQSSQYYDPRIASSSHSIASVPLSLNDAASQPIPSRKHGPGPSPSASSHTISRGSSQPLSPNSLPSPSSIPPDSPGQTLTLYNYPQANSSTPTSLYSSYSYYPFDEALPSPVISGTPQFLDSPPPLKSHSSHHLSPAGHLSPTPSPSPSPSPSWNASASPTAASPSSASSPGSGPMSSDDYLQLGIKHHEANRLRDSAVCFEKSAHLAESEQGASGVGMLMWGLALRHGWGCAKDEKQGFSWLRRAAEAAVGDLEKARVDAASSAVKGELVLAIYEVGQCFFQGWGVKKDQKMGVSYFQAAANLGDADAQQELAFCLANGRGCKKDRKEAAKWYREAVKQGVSDVGLAWIYKEKFQ